jgi:hypothetical protein
MRTIFIGITILFTSMLSIQSCSKEVIETSTESSTLIKRNLQKNL